MTGSPATAQPLTAPPQPVALVDLLDRLLGTGVVITGDILISVADVDLVRVSLRALLATAGEIAGQPEEA